MLKQSFFDEMKVAGKNVSLWFQLDHVPKAFDYGSLEGRL
jgi:hypothetical protein